MLLNNIHIKNDKFCLRNFVKLNKRWRTDARNTKLICEYSIQLCTSRLHVQGDTWIFWYIITKNYRIKNLRIFVKHEWANVNWNKIKFNKMKLSWYIYINMGIFKILHYLLIRKSRKIDLHNIKLLICQELFQLAACLIYSTMG